MNLRESYEIDRMLEEARFYRSLGFSIIPLEPRGKKPLIQWKVYQSRHPSEVELERWFARSANIGLVTGGISKVVVIDADSEEVVEHVIREYGDSPWRTKTANGSHFFYRHPGIEIPNRAKLKKLKLDVRADGGYVVAAPSIHPLGVAYERIGDWSATTLSAFNPEWVSDRETDGQRNQSIVAIGDPVAAERYISRIQSIAGQGGDNAAFRAATALVKFGLSFETAWSILVRWNQRNAAPPWSEQRLSRKLEEAIRLHGGTREKIKSVFMKGDAVVTVKRSGGGTCIMCQKEGDGYEAEFTDGTLKGFLCVRDFNKAVKSRSKKQKPEVAKEKE